MEHGTIKMCERGTCREFGAETTVEAVHRMSYGGDLRPIALEHISVNRPSPVTTLLANSSRAFESTSTYGKRGSGRAAAELTS